uniref:Uncharacterized protein n=1 Tax=Arundo donax TaxID=35708 RepID=A0A0A9CBJ4_ARUDO
MGCYVNSVSDRFSLNYASLSCHLFLLTAWTEFRLSSWDLLYS